MQVTFISLKSWKNEVYDTAKYVVQVSSYTTYVVSTHVHGRPIDDDQSHSICLMTEIDNDQMNV